MFAILSSGSSWGWSLLTAFHNVVSNFRLILDVLTDML